MYTYILGAQIIITWLYTLIINRRATSNLLGKGFNQQKRAHKILPKDHVFLIHIFQISKQNKSSANFQDFVSFKWKQAYVIKVLRKVSKFSIKGGTFLRKRVGI